MISASQSLSWLHSVLIREATPITVGRFGLGPLENQGKLGSHPEGVHEERMESVMKA